MTVDELIEALEKVQKKEAKVYFRCTCCDRCNSVQEANERHDLITDDFIIMLEEQA